VDEHERLSVARDEVASPRSPPLGEPLLEAGQL
jgi:hypothetical protein